MTTLPVVQKPKPDMMQCRDAPLLPTADPVTEIDAALWIEDLKLAYLDCKQTVAAIAAMYR